MFWFPFYFYSLPLTSTWYRNRKLNHSLRWLRNPHTHTVVHTRFVWINFVIDIRQNLCCGCENDYDHYCFFGGELLNRTSNAGGCLRSVILYILIALFYNSLPRRIKKKSNNGKRSKQNKTLQNRMGVKRMVFLKCDEKW